MLPLCFPARLNVGFLWLIFRTYLALFTARKPSRFSVPVSGPFRSRVFRHISWRVTYLPLQGSCPMSAFLSLGWPAWTWLESFGDPPPPSLNLKTSLFHIHSVGQEVNIKQLGRQFTSRQRHFWNFTSSHVWPGQILSYSLLSEWITSCLSCQGTAGLQKSQRFSSHWHAGYKRVTTRSPTHGKPKNFLYYLPPSPTIVAFRPLTLAKLK